MGHVGERLIEDLNELIEIIDSRKMSDFWVPQDLSDFMKFGSDVMKFMVFDTFLDRYLITFKEGFGCKMGQKGVPKRVQKVTKRGQKPKISRARGDSLTNIT